MRSHAAWTRTGALLASVAAGCGPGTTSDGGGTGSSGTVDDGPQPSAGAVTTGPGDSSGPPPATSGDESSGDSTTGGASSTGVEGCPPRERFAADFTVTPDADVSATCSVVAVGGDPGATIVDLDCERVPVTLALGHSPEQGPPSVTVGQMVAFQYVTDTIFWINRWFSLHSAEGEVDFLLAGGISGSALDPPGTTIGDFFGGYPMVTEVGGVCELQSDDCGQFQRLALDFTLAEGGPFRVLDGEMGHADVLAYGYHFDVQTAIRYEKPVGCDDLPAAWYEVLLIWFPSD